MRNACSCCQSPPHITALTAAVTLCTCCHLTWYKGTCFRGPPFATPGSHWRGSRRSWIWTAPPLVTSASKRKSPTKHSRGLSRKTDGERKQPLVPLCSESFRTASPILTTLFPASVFQLFPFPAASDPRHDELRRYTSRCRTGTVVYIARFNRARCHFTAAPNRPIARPVSTDDTPPLPDDVFVKEGET